MIAQPHLEPEQRDDDAAHALAADAKAFSRFSAAPDMPLCCTDAHIAPVMRMTDAKACCSTAQPPTFRYAIQ